MRHIVKSFRIIVSICLLFAFLSVLFVSHPLNSFGCLKTAAAGENPRAYTEVFECADSQNLYARDFIGSLSGSENILIKNSKAELSKIEKLAAFFIAVQAGISLWKDSKKTRFAFLQSYLYPVACFLRNLRIQQKKDGKKRAFI